MRDYGCLMVDFAIPNYGEYAKGLVDPNDIYAGPDNEHGIEKEPHCTILYGIHDDKIDLDKLSTVLMDLEKVVCRFNSMTIFEQPEFDVLKFDIESMALRNMNNRARTFKHTTDFPDYKPHVTIAYLKPGTGKKYVKRLDKPFILIPVGYTYWRPNGEKVEWD